MITAKRLTVWGVALFGLSWFIYIHTISSPGLIDRAGRFKGTDYIQFYVMGSLVLDGRTDALYDADAHLQEGRRRIDPGLELHASHPNYGPQVALLFAPMALLPFGWSLAIFLLFTAMCYGVSVWLVWRECPGLRNHGRLVALLAAGSPLFLTLFRYGQLTALALFLFSAAFVAMRRNRLFVAGLVLGGLAYKPQFGVVLALVLLAGRQWRIAAGAAMAVAAQLALAWLGAGAQPLVQYGEVLWMLARNPQLIELYPTELHSLRGFFQLLIEPPAAVTACFLVALGAVLAAAVRSWSSRAPLGAKWGELVLLTVLASPHLIAYDLVLLTMPLLLFADWAVRHPDHHLHPDVSLLLVLLYFAPFSGSLIAQFTHVQLSVVAMVVLAWRMYSICRITVTKLRLKPPSDGRAAGGESSLLSTSCEPRNRRPEMRRGVVPELDDARVTFERRLHDAALNSTAAPVDQAHFMESRRRRGFDVLFDDRADVRRRKGVEIDLVFDWDSIVVSHQSAVGQSQSAVGSRQSAVGQSAVGQSASLSRQSVSRRSSVAWSVVSQ
jgi:alpha-1,2-mannosyltransferase